MNPLPTIEQVEALAARKRELAYMKEAMRILRESGLLYSLRDREQTNELP